MKIWSEAQYAERGGGAHYGNYPQVPNKHTGACNRTEGKNCQNNKCTVHNKRTEGTKLSKLIIVQGILIIQR